MSFFTVEHSAFVDEQGVSCVAANLDIADDALLDYPWRHGLLFKPSPPTPLSMQALPVDGAGPVYFDYVESPIPLLSAGMKRAWELCGVSNVDYYAVQIENPQTGVEIPVYFAFNVIGRVSVADPALSVSSRSFGRPGADLFTTFVPRADLESDLRVFRMLENMSTLVVHESVMNACLDQGIDTLDFVPLAQWRR